MKKMKKGRTVCLERSLKTLKSNFRPVAIFNDTFRIINLFQVVFSNSNNEQDSLGMTELSPNFSAMMLENREFHNPVYPVH